MRQVNRLDHVYFSRELKLIRKAVIVEVFGGEGDSKRANYGQVHFIRRGGCLPGVGGCVRTDPDETTRIDDINISQTDERIFLVDSLPHLALGYADTNGIARKDLPP